MDTLQDIEDIFSGLHDGTIESWEKNKSSLTLKISCLYLAEQIDKTFEYFYVELIEVHKLELFTWKSLIEEEQETVTDFERISKWEFEIIDANKEENEVRIFGNLDDDSQQYCGGNLKLNSKEVKIYDHNKTPLTIEQFRENCRRYWSNFEG